MSTEIGREDARRSAAQLGIWAAALTSLLALVSFVVAFLTPPRSGPTCTFAECVGYPYTDIAEYFPRDYFWMFPATLVPFAFVVLAVCVHYYAAPARRPFTLAAVVLSGIAAGSIGIDYFIQLTVIQPSVLRGELDGLSLFSQYNPHGVFIALEAIGYLLVTGSLLFLAAAFDGASRLELVLRWMFILAFALAVAAVVGFTVAYGQDVEYRFEIAVISIAWSTQIVGGTLLVVLFRRAVRASTHT